MLIWQRLNTHAEVDREDTQRLALRKHRQEDRGLRQTKIVAAVHHRTLLEIGNVQKCAVTKAQRHGRSECSLRLLHRNRSRLRREVIWNAVQSIPHSIKKVNLHVRGVQQTG